MSTATKNNQNKKWLIDTHGIRDALKSRNNSIRVAVISAIESGEMLIMKAASKEIKDLYPEIYNDFKSINGKKYFTPTTTTSARATLLMESHGSNLLGSVPMFESFQFMASAISEGLTCVSAGKSYSSCKKILSKLGPPPNVLNLENFSTIA